VKVQLPVQEGIKGLIVKSTGNLYHVRCEDGRIIECRLRGKFRKERIKTTNPIAVGDRVIFIQDSDSPCGVITSILLRKNYVGRKSINLSKISHIIAANVDIVFLVISLKDPRTPLGFVDRFLTTVESFRIPAVIVWNKVDLYNESLRSEAQRIKSIYQPIGYHCIDTSVVSRFGIEELKTLMQDKISLFSGQSGVGKSSLINLIEPRLQLKVADVSHFNSKGKHTTTFSELFELSFGGYIIDTPGMKEFGLIKYSQEEISHYFPEMLKVLGDCKFNNCTHTHEPNCAVKSALEAGKIAPTRYQSYLSIIHNEDINLKDWML
jgi:ribosome biogenesis GTPase